MVFARVSSWEFKPNQRKIGLEMLENSVSELVRKTAGFRGMVVFLSHDDPNLGIVITMWNSEELEKAFADGVSKMISQKLEQFVTGPPKVTHHTVYSAEFKQ